MEKLIRKKTRKNPEQVAGRELVAVRRNTEHDPFPRELTVSEGGQDSKSLKNQRPSCHLHKNYQRDIGRQK